MKHHHGHGRRYGRPGGWQQAGQPDASDAADWFAGRLPDAWFDGDPTVAVEAQDRYGRKVSWGVEVGGERILFTHIAVPVMTRLKQPERQVLDTLVDAGVARSRADALAWSVKLVGEHAEEWLAKLRG